MRDTRQASAWQCGKSRSWIIVGIGISLLVVAWQTLQRPPQQRHDFFGASGIEIKTPEQKLERVDAFYQEKIDPLLDSYQQKNVEAAERAIATLQDHFASFHRGIDAFTEDATSWGTRFKVLGGMSKAWWDGWWNDQTDVDQVKQYMTEKFKEHVLSEDKLRTALHDAINQYRDDITANRNELMGQVKATLVTRDVPIDVTVKEGDFGRFADQVHKQAAGMLDGVGEKSAVSGVLANVAGELAGYGASHLLLNFLVSRVGISAGATVVGGVVGGASGSVAPVVGNVIGVGVGLMVGAAIDWWMTEEFRDKIAIEITGFLHDLEYYTLQGPKDKTLPEQGAGWIGVVHIFHDANATVTTSMRQALHQALVEAVI